MLLIQTDYAPSIFAPKTFHESLLLPLPPPTPSPPAAAADYYYYHHHYILFIVAVVCWLLLMLLRLSYFYYYYYYLFIRCYYMFIIKVIKQPCHRQHLWTIWFSCLPPCWSIIYVMLQLWRIWSVKNKVLQSVTMWCYKYETYQLFTYRVISSPQASLQTDFTYDSFHNITCTPI